ncbi:unnamed protein product [Leuciscus chuanchicus]
MTGQVGSGDSTAEEQSQVTLKGGMVPILGSLPADLLCQQPPAYTSQVLSLLAMITVGRESGIGYKSFSHYNPFIVMETIMRNNAQAHLGFTTSKQKVCFDDQDVEEQALLNTIHTAHLAWINDKSAPGSGLSCRKIGCPDKFVNIVRLFHGGMLDQVRDDGGLSDPSPMAPNWAVCSHHCYSASSFP